MVVWYGDGLGGGGGGVGLGGGGGGGGVIWWWWWFAVRWKRNSCHLREIASL